MTTYDSYIGNELRQSDAITPALIERYKAVIGDDGRKANLPYGLHSVSYTHLTLPTNREV